MAGSKRDQAAWFTVFGDSIEAEYDSDDSGQRIAARLEMTPRDGPAWRIAIRYEFDSTGGDAVEITIRPLTDDVPDGGIGSVMLRQLRLGEAIQAGRHALALELPGIKPQSRPGEPGRAGYATPEHFFLALAVRASELTGQRDGAQTLADEFGYSKEHIGRLLGQCEKKWGFLGPARSGRFQRIITDKALARKKELDGVDQEGR